MRRCRGRGKQKNRGFSRTLISSLRIVAIIIEGPTLPEASEVIGQPGIAAGRARLIKLDLFFDDISQ